MFIWKERSMKPINLNNIVAFEAFVEEQVKKVQYGTITFNVMLLNGVPRIETTNYIVNKRIKYPTINAGHAEIDSNSESVI